MENRPDRTLILSNLIVASHSAEGEILLQKEYESLTADNSAINNINYCEVKNIAERSTVKNDRITITFKFDIIIVYEYSSLNDIKRYGIYTESTEKMFDICLDQYKPRVSSSQAELCTFRSILRDIKIEKEIDISRKNATITVTSSIESYILKEEAVECTVPILTNKSSDKVETDNNMILPVVVNSLDENSLSTYMDYVRGLLKKASDISQINKELEQKMSSMNKKISYLEFKDGEAKKECIRLSSELKVKEKIIEDLKVKFERNQKRIEILQNTNQILNNDLASAVKENEDLKTYKNEEEVKKKKSLNYRIKSAINNMKLFI